MKKGMLIFFAAIVILGGAFAEYFNWLLIQQKHGVVQMKVSSPRLLPTPAGATTSWLLLDPMQQEALAPLSQQWDNLLELQRRRLLKMAKHYQNFTPEQKHRFHNRLESWSKLTPEQREDAREKYLAFSKVPAEKRDQVKQMVSQNQAKQFQQPSSSVAVAPLPLQP